MIQALNGLRPFALPWLVARGRGSAPVWTPASNFPLGTEPGLWYDPSSFTGLYQDSAGTSPATAVGQPNGKMLDKSGRNNHISQATASARPIINNT